MFCDCDSCQLWWWIPWNKFFHVKVISFCIMKAYNNKADWSLFQHAPGVPKILVGNRLHLAYKRQVSEGEAEAYALKNEMAFFEVSPLCDFNVTESFAELSRVAIKRNGMTRSWGGHKGRCM